MNWPQQPPPPPPGYPPQQQRYPPPPAPPDARIKAAVRRGQAFDNPYDAARAVGYAEGFLKNGRDLTRPPIVLAIIAGLLVTVGLQVAVGNVFALVIPLGAILGLLVYIVWFSAHRGKVEQALHANRRVLGQ
jgi:hypothetical protein